MNNSLRELAEFTDFKFVLVSKEKDANVRIYMQHLDGMFGTLGVAYQPFGDFEDMGAVQVMTPPFIGDIIIDLSENWNVNDLHSVVFHELLHSVGYFHDEHPESIMNAFSNGITTMGPTDIAVGQMKYGKPINLNEGGLSV